MLYNYDNVYFIYFRKIFYSLLWKNYGNLAKTMDLWFTIEKPNLRYNTANYEILI